MYQACSLNECESPSDRSGKRARFDPFGRLPLIGPFQNLKKGRPLISSWKKKKTERTWVQVLTDEKKEASDWVMLKFENNGERGGS